MRFVTPESVRIDLKDGPDGEKNWIEIKRELTVGEEKKFRAAGLQQMSQGTEGQTSIEVDWQKMALARVLAYLMDWSAVRPDPKDKGKTKPVPVTKDTVAALTQEDFEEIDEAIQAHMASEVERKKTPAVSPASPTT